MSPSKEANNANLHLTILRNEYDDDIGENIDRILYDDVFNYISHEGKKKTTIFLFNTIFKRIFL